MTVTVAVRDPVALPVGVKLEEAENDPVLKVFAEMVGVTEGLSVRDADDVGVGDGMSYSQMYG